MKRSKLLFLIIGGCLLIASLTLPVKAEIPADLDPKKGTVTCPDGTVHKNITTCFSGDVECTPDAYPC